MTMIAKYPGQCPICRCQIMSGSSINWAPGSGASHVACGAPARTASGKLRCGCGNTGNAGRYPFSESPESGYCDDCV